MAVKAYDLLTGRVVTPVAASEWKISLELSAAGTLEVTVPASKQAAGQNLLENTRAWRTVLVDTEWVTEAGVRVERPRASGIVFSRRLGPKEAVFSCCGFGDLFAKYLVINSALKDRVIREQVIDPEAEDVVVPAEWRTHVEGSTADMLVELIELALEWQPLNVILPVRQGGGQYRDYYGTDLATVADRVDDIAALQGGAEWVWEPVVVDGRLYHRLHVGDPELVRSVHRINATLDGAPVSEVSYVEDGASMGTDQWAQGGKQDDRILIARTHVPTLEDLGWPRLMGVVSGHEAVSDVATLAGYTDSAAASGVSPSEVFSFRVRRDRWDVRPGDHIDLKWRSWFMPSARWWRLKALTVDGDQGEWLTVSARERV